MRARVSLPRTPSASRPCRVWNRRTASASGGVYWSSAGIAESAARSPSRRSCACNAGTPTYASPTTTLLRGDARGGSTIARLRREHPVSCQQALQPDVQWECGLGRVDRRREPTASHGIAQLRHERGILRRRAKMGFDLLRTHAAEAKIGQELQHRYRHRGVCARHCIGIAIAASECVDFALERADVVVLGRKPTLASSPQRLQRDACVSARPVGSEPDGIGIRRRVDVFDPGGAHAQPRRRRDGIRVNGSDGGIPRLEMRIGARRAARQE